MAPLLQSLGRGRVRRRFVAVSRCTISIPPTTDSFGPTREDVTHDDVGRGP